MNNGEIKARGGKREGAGRKRKGVSTPQDTQKRTLPDALRANLWQPGVCPNPKGRPKGSRNKLGEDFVAALQSDFQAHGQHAIVEVRETRPHEYLKVIAGILPKELKVTTGVVEELSDDELAAAIATLQSVLSAQSANQGSGEEEGGQQTEGLPTLQ